MISTAGFFDPYLDTLGGGERYTLTLAEYLSQRDWRVDLFWDDPGLKEKLESRLNLNLKRVNFVSKPRNVFEKWKMGRNYDLFFWLSDGSIPFLFARKNILHFQVPFHNIGGRSFWNQIKLKKISSLVCNSQFTKKFIDQEFNVCSRVIYPPIDTDSFKPGKKENLILSVGRFSQLLQAKRQDVLIEVFQKMVDRGLKDWQLVLVGGADVGATEYLVRLKKQAKNYPIEILENLEFKRVQEFYGKAKIFWNASGFGVDEEQEPGKVEHFGMVVVEAMAAGCVSIVVGKGGVREIIEEDKTGFFWEDEGELIRQTLNLIKSPTLAERMFLEVIKSSQKYSKEKFCQEFEALI